MVTSILEGEGVDRMNVRGSASNTRSNRVWDLR